jgi:hypothetical protein
LCPSNPKFASEFAAKFCELRIRDTSVGTAAETVS